MTQLAKQKLMIIFVSVALLFAFVGFFFANNSLAWFSENKEATAEGLSVNAKVSPNLIIGKSEEQIKQQNILFSVDFDTSRKDMIAVTHDDAIEGTYLKYLTNHYAVDTHTGNVKEGMELIFAPVPTKNNEAYFIDYTVYIASAFDPLDVSSLTAEIIIPDFVDEKHPYFNAASIDFYVVEGNTNIYRGTTSVSDSIRGTAKAKIELMPGGGTVPLNTAENGYIKVIMRCYFDGALQDPDTGNAYVNSYTVLTDGVFIGVSFTATDAAADE